MFAQVVVFTCLLLLCAFSFSAGCFACISSFDYVVYEIKPFIVYLAKWFFVFGGLCLDYLIYVITLCVCMVLLDASCI